MTTLTCQLTASELDADELGEKIADMKYELSRLHALPVELIDRQTQTDIIEVTSIFSETDAAQGTQVMIDEKTQTPHLVEEEAVQTETAQLSEDCSQTAYQDQFPQSPPAEEPDFRRSSGPKIELETCVINKRDFYWCAGMALPKYSLGKQHK